MVDFTDEFFAKARTWVDDIYDTRPSTVPPTVYHYTDAAGLVGMLKTGRVWAADYRFLNDKSEVEHTRKGVRERITRKLGETEDDLMRRLYGDIIDFQDMPGASDAFVFSLSAERDDLSQWRGYAREGQGFTIGFSGRVLCRQAEGDESDYAFFKIEYDHGVQDQAMERALADIEEKVQAMVKQKPSTEKKICMRAAAAYDWLTEARAVAHKHNSFKSEREWRVVVHLHPGGPLEVQVRSSGLRLIRYLEFELDDTGRLPITEIGIGPGFTGSEEVVAVKTLCNSLGYKPEIYYADTPYRRLG